MLVFVFLNETKAARLFERCESESVLQICPQNCPQKGLERVSTMQHSFVHMGQNQFWALVRNTTKPNKITPERTNFRFLITRRSQVQVLSPQPTKARWNDKFQRAFFYIMVKVVTIWSLWPQNDPKTRKRLRPNDWTFQPPGRFCG